MAVQVDTDMERGFAQLYEIQKRFLNGSLSPLATRQPLQDIIEGKFPATSQYDRYTPYLLSLEDQLAQLRGYDTNLWSRFVADREDWFDTVDTASDHIQSVDDLEILYVDFGSPEINVEMWWKVLVGTHPNAWRWDELKVDSNHLRLTPTANQYEPGIHRIRINLVAHWESKQGRSVLQVREQAARSGEYLAHAEVMAAYAVHDELLRQQDGENLPYADMAGFEATVPGNESWTHCLCLDWDRSDRRVELDAGEAGNVEQSWAAPELREL